LRHPAKSIATKYSRWVEVSLVPAERVETFVRALAAHLAALPAV
jgi:hypothetical protein